MSCGLIELTIDVEERKMFKVDGGKSCSHKIKYFDSGVNKHEGIGIERGQSDSKISKGNNGQWCFF